MTSERENALLDLVAESDIAVLRKLAGLVNDRVRAIEERAALAALLDALPSWDEPGNVIQVSDDREGTYILRVEKGRAYPSFGARTAGWGVVEPPVEEQLRRMVAYYRRIADRIERNLPPRA